MNREIKFRVWDQDDNIMMSWEQLIHLNSFKYLFKNILLQYTNLKDKNGKEIYEGDIVRTICGTNLEIFWVKQGYWSWYESSLEISEIIGNIYQNPELLETK